MGRKRGVFSSLGHNENLRKLNQAEEHRLQVTLGRIEKQHRLEETQIRKDIQNVHQFQDTLHSNTVGLVQILNVQHAPIPGTDPQISWNNRILSAPANGSFLNYSPTDRPSTCSYPFFVSQDQPYNIIQPLSVESMEQSPSNTSRYSMESSDDLFCDSQVSYFSQDNHNQHHNLKPSHSLLHHTSAKPNHTLTNQTSVELNLGIARPWMIPKSKKKFSSTLVEDLPDEKDIASDPLFTFDQYRIPSVKAFKRPRLPQRERLPRSYSALKRQVQLQMTYSS